MLISFLFFFAFHFFSGKLFISPLRTKASPGGSDGKESAYNVGDPDSLPGWGRYLGVGNGNPLQYSCLENSVRERSLEHYSPWNSPSQNTVVGSLSLLQGIFPLQ